MGWWQKRKKRKAEEEIKAMGWGKPTIKWSIPKVLQFQLSAHDESGEMVEEWYLGTRGYNEPDAMFMLVAYGLTEASVRIVGPEEAVQIWSKWLSCPSSIAERFLFAGSLKECMPLYKTWIDWAKDGVENCEVAEEQISALSDSCTFRVSVG